VASNVLDLKLRRLDIAESQILGEICLQVGTTETVALVGPSGVGKTSLLRIIAGLEHGYCGDCSITGRVAVVFQEPTLLPWRTVSENLTIPTGISYAQALEALSDIGLAGRDSGFPAQLSLGQQRRLALVRAFAVKPDLLLMDEPFVSLDPALVDEMMALFNKLRAGQDIATILVTHVEEEAARLADRIVRLGGSPAQIISDTNSH